MQASGSDDGPITSINVTPLVDIILVVLIIFMATAPLIQRRSIKVDVPEASHHDRAALEALAVVLTAKHEIYLAGRLLGEAQVGTELARHVSNAGGVQVTLSADRVIPYGEIVHVLDVVRAAGVRKIGLEVRGK